MQSLVLKIALQLFHFPKKWNSQELSIVRYKQIIQCTMIVFSKKSPVINNKAEMCHVPRCDYNYHITTIIDLECVKRKLPL